MSPRSRRLVAPLVVGALTLGATAYVGLVDPGEPGHYPLCPTQALTGLDCPACGGLRAVHALAHGDLVGALDHNAYVVLVLLPLAVVAWTVWVVRAWRGPDTPTHPGHPALPAPVQQVGVGGPADPGGAAAVEHQLARRTGFETDADASESERRFVGDVAGTAPAAVAVRSTGWADPRLMWALLALALVFTVVRNIDAVPALQWLGSGVGRS